MNDWENFKKKCDKIKGKEFGINHNILSLKSKIQYDFIEKINDIPIIVKNNISNSVTNNFNKKSVYKKYNINAKIDLHGLTINESYNAIKRFFEVAVSRNYRVLLIITGKGLHSDGRETIKENFIKWLKEDYFLNKVISYNNANLKDGGDGAFYVLLKNQNKFSKK